MCMSRWVAAGVGMIVGLCCGTSNTWAFSASYDQRITQGRQVIEGKVVMQDQEFRMDEDVEGQQMVTIRNRSGVYSYIPREHMVIKVNELNISQQPIQHADNYQAYLQEHQAQRMGTETVAGHTCDVYRFTDPAAGGAVTAWVWTEKQFPVKMEMAGAIIELSNIQLGIAVPQDTFQLPSGVQVMDMGALLPSQ